MKVKILSAGFPQYIRRRKFFAAALSIATAGIIMGLGTCGPSDYYYEKAQNRVTVGGSGDDGTKGVPAETQKAVSTFKPVLAVRGMGCIMCHAGIHSNVVTDFGAGDPIFMGSQGFSQSINTLGGDNRFYNNLVCSWQSSDLIDGTISTASDGTSLVTPSKPLLDVVEGTVYVPKMKVSMNNGQGTVIGDQIKNGTLFSADSNRSFNSDTTLVDLLTTSYVDKTICNTTNKTCGCYSYNNYPIAPATQKIIPASGPPVVDLTGVRIQAPTDEDLTTLDSTFVSRVGQSEADFKQVGDAPSPALALRGLMVTTDKVADTRPPNGYLYYVTNAPLSGTSRIPMDLYCSGDVLVVGPLFLKNVVLHTDDRGCRLYVKGTVMVQGPIKFDNDNGLKNIQIASSRAIIFGHNLTRLQNRLKYNPWVRPTPDLPNPLDVQAAITREFSSVGSPGNFDASDGNPNLESPADYPMVPNCKRNVNGTYISTSWCSGAGTLAAIQYQHILLNAPIIYSRYLGEFKGVMIAELAMAALGQFHFEFDSRFQDQNITILPKLPHPSLVLAP